VQIMGLGINYSNGAPLVEPMDEQVFAGTIQKSLLQNAEEADIWR
jgi:hypothetical protein